MLPEIVGIDTLTAVAFDVSGFVLPDECWRMRYVHMRALARCHVSDLQRGVSFGAARFIRVARDVRVVHAESYGDALCLADCVETACWDSAGEIV